MTVINRLAAMTGQRVDSNSLAGAIDNEIDEAERRMKKYIDNELAELALLAATEKVEKSVYEMSPEEYMRLPGNVRL